MYDLHIKMWVYWLRAGEDKRRRILARNIRYITVR